LKLMKKPMLILGFAGSLREDSYNKALLRAAVALAPEGVQIEIFDLEGIPPFNQDLEEKPPGKVKEFKALIRAADALLIASPEYNYGAPGILKNAIDWASRPYGDNVFDGKPVALMSASPGMLGGARAQYQIRQTLVALNMFVLNRPEVIVCFADEKIGGNGKVTDEETRQRIRKLVKSLDSWTRRLEA